MKGRSKSSKGTPRRTPVAFFFLRKHLRGASSRRVGRSAGDIITRATTAVNHRAAAANSRASAIRVRGNNPSCGMDEPPSLCPSGGSLMSVIGSFDAAALVPQTAAPPESWCLPYNQPLKTDAGVLIMEIDFIHPRNLQSILQALYIMHFFFLFCNVIGSSTF
jgi:hypothetical protein